MPVRLNGSARVLNTVSSDSQYNLGVLYEQGLGISPNLTESLFWFDVANRNGDGGAPAKIAELIERVSPEAAAQARSRAATWQPATANAIANGRFGAQPWNMGNPLQGAGDPESTERAWLCGRNAGWDHGRWHGHGDPRIPAHQPICP